MKRILLPIMGATALTVAFAMGESAEVELRYVGLYTYPKSTDPLYYTFAISSERADRQPVWQPGSGAVPLTLDEATRIARDYIGKQLWQAHFRDFERICLIRLRSNDEPRWMYSFARPYRTEDAIATVPDTVIVLLDGTVVEPTTSTKPRTP